VSRPNRPTSRAGGGEAAGIEVGADECVLGHGRRQRRHGERRDIALTRGMQRRLRAEEPVHCGMAPESHHDQVRTTACGVEEDAAQRHAALDEAFDRWIEAGARTLLGDRGPPRGQQRFVM